MWGLDRFSAHSTPAPSPPPQQFRPYSPGPPRRSTNLASAPLPSRPSLGSRTSSTSHLSNASTTNVAAGRPTSSSGLKNQIYNTPPADIENPLKALERVIGYTIGLDKVGGLPGYTLSGKPSNLVEDVDFGGLSLQQYADRGKTHLKGSNGVPAYSEQSVEEFERERTKFENLHKSILTCDETLQSMESYLTNFQSDLGAVSAEIETLQTRSTNLNAKLDTRKTVEKSLGPMVEQIIISPAVVKKISEGPIDEGWVHALAELQDRSKAIAMLDKQADSPKAISDSKPLIASLSDKAVERIRDYFAAQIKALRSPNINAQVIQKQNFLQYTPLYAFLARRQPQLAEDVGHAYINTMRWYYQSLFARYHASISKLKLYTTDRHDVLGEDASTKPRSTNPNPSHDPFNLARRIDILRNPTDSALPSHAAEEVKTAQFLETPFLAFNLALVDNASFEYTFLATFFSPPTDATLSTATRATITRHFHTIFEPVFTLGQTLTKSLIADSYDALGVLLCVRLTQHFAFTLQRRRVPALESYINGTHMQLWPRFQLVVDAHCDSLKRLAASLPQTASQRPNAAASAITSSSQASTTAPHPAAQRFANLVAGVLALSADAGDDEPVAASLARLRGEFEGLLTRMGVAFGAGDKGRRERERFLANNYALVCAILGDAKGKLAEETKARFEELRRLHAA